GGGRRLRWRSSRRRRAKLPDEGPIYGPAPCRSAPWARWVSPVKRSRPSALLQGCGGDSIWIRRSALGRDRLLGGSLSRPGTLLRESLDLARRQLGHRHPQVHAVARHAAVRIEAVLGADGV